MIDDIRVKEAREKLSLLISENRPSKAYTTDEWVAMAKIIAPNYDYSKVKYIDKATKVIVICPKHGEFLVNPKYFLWSNCECPVCAKIRRNKIEQEIFIEGARKVHGDKYDYSKVEYNNSKNKVCIICPIHGEFWQTRANHINNKTGCPECAKEKNKDVRRMTLDEFVQRSMEMYGEYRFDYSKVDYKNTETPVELICKEKDENGVEHGSFFIRPHVHLKKDGKGGCQKCLFKSNGYGGRLNTEKFIERARSIFGNKYDYSRVNYTIGKDKVEIICPIHGSFMQKAEAHLIGQGCPKCKSSYLEDIVCGSFDNNHINYEYQKRFKEWLGAQSLDIYLPELNIGIECQGIQHYVPVLYRRKGYTMEDARKNFEVISERDRRKREACKENGVELIYFLEKKNESLEKSGLRYFTNKDELLAYIKERLSKKLTP